jgi:hypothetical protein
LGDGIGRLVSGVVAPQQLLKLPRKVVAGQVEERLFSVDDALSISVQYMVSIMEMASWNIPQSTCIDRDILQ